jgi:integrase
MRNLSDPVTLVWARAGLYSDWRGYTVKVRLSNGRTLKWRAPMSLRSKDAAEKWAHQRWENQVTKETKQLTVEQVDDLWKEYRFQKVGRAVKGISMATYESDRTDMKNHILPQLGGEIMERIPILQLRQWMMYLNRKDLSSHSIRSIRNTLSRCYEDAILNEWVSLAANPMQHPSIKEAMPVVRGLDLRTVVHISIYSLYRLLDSERIPQKWKTCYAFGGLTGMDIGEILGLQWKHLHLKSKIPFVRVLQACQSRSISGHGKLGPTKRPSRIRTIPL